jgi:hypothetical protein
VPVAKKKEAVVKEKAVTLPKIKLAEKRKPTTPPVSESASPTLSAAGAVHATRVEGR